MGNREPINVFEDISHEESSFDYIDKYDLLDLTEGRLSEAVRELLKTLSLWQFRPEIVILPAPERRLVLTLLWDGSFACIDEYPPLPYHRTKPAALTQTTRPYTHPPEIHDLDPGAAAIEENIPPRSWEVRRSVKERKSRDTSIKYYKRLSTKIQEVLVPRTKIDIQPDAEHLMLSRRYPRLKPPKPPRFEEVLLENMIDEYRYIYQENRQMDTQDVVDGLFDRDIRLIAVKYENDYWKIYHSQNIQTGVFCEVCVYGKCSNKWRKIMWRHCQKAQRSKRFIEMWTKDSTTYMVFRIIKSFSCSDRRYILGSQSIAVEEYNTPGFLSTGEPELKTSPQIDDISCFPYLPISGKLQLTDIQGHQSLVRNRSYAEVLRPVQFNATDPSVPLDTVVTSAQVDDINCFPYLPISGKPQLADGHGHNSLFRNQQYAEVLRTGQFDAIESNGPVDTVATCLSIELMAAALPHMRQQLQFKDHQLNYLQKLDEPYPAAINFVKQPVSKSKAPIEADLPPKEADCVETINPHADSRKVRRKNKAKDSRRAKRQRERREKTQRRESEACQRAEVSGSMPTVTKAPIVVSSNYNELSTSYHNYHDTKFPSGAVYPDSRDGYAGHKHQLYGNMGVNERETYYADGLVYSDGNAYTSVEALRADQELWARTRMASTQIY